MPKNQYGEHAEIIFNALGVCNRLNPSQLYEVELNFIADNIQRKIKDAKTNKEKLNWILEFLKDINPQEAVAVNEYLKTLDKKGIINFIKDTEENGFYLHQPPFWDNIGFDELREIYKKYDFIEPYECTINGKPIKNRLIFGYEYIMKLIF